MSRKTIDIHAHAIAEETVGLMQKEAPKVGPRITPVDADNAAYEVAGVTYRQFPRGGFDLERRFKDMAASDVDMGWRRSCGCSRCASASRSAHERRSRACLSSSPAQAGDPVIRGFSGKFEACVYWMPRLRGP
jgi:hypothetical protein